MTICSRCKRELVNKDSIKLGLGPACAKLLGVKKEKRLKEHHSKILRTKNKIRGFFNE